MAIAVALAGCKGESTSLKDAPKETVTADWTEYDRPELGLHVAAPSHWWLRNPEYEPLMGGMDLSNLPPPGEGGGEVPELKEPPNEVIAEDAARQKEKGLSFVLYYKGKTTIAEKISRIEIKKEDVGAITVKGAMEKAKAALASDATVKEYQHPQGPIAEARHTDTSIGGDQITRINYGFANGSEYWSVFFESWNNPTVVEQDCEAIIKTLRIKPKT